jgi:hypothetical protein
MQGCLSWSAGKDGGISQDLGTTEHHQQPTTTQFQCRAHAFTFALGNDSSSHRLCQWVDLQNVQQANHDKSFVMCNKPIMISYFFALPLQLHQTESMAASGSMLASFAPFYV